MISVLLVDDQSQVRQALAAVVSRETDMRVVGQARDGGEAVIAARELDPMVVVMDAEMPGMDGIEATRRLHNEAPHSRVIGFAMHDGETETGFLQAGAYTRSP